MMSESYIVDWQQSEDKHASALVSVRMGGRGAGLYRIKEVMPEGMLLSHGAISFPVGTQLDVESLPDSAPVVNRHMRVTANDQRGLGLCR